MFKEYNFIATQKGISGGELVTLRISPISLILPLASGEYSEGEESGIMADVLLSFIKSFNKSYKLVKITQ